MQHVQCTIMGPFCKTICYMYMQFGSESSIPSRTRFKKVEQFVLLCTTILRKGLNQFKFAPQAICRRVKSMNIMQFTLKTATFLASQYLAATLRRLPTGVR